MSSGRVAAWVFAAALAAGVGGCAEKAHPAPPPSRPSARLVATRDFGRVALVDARVAPDQSVLAALQGATRVDQQGGFVRSIAGQTGSLTDQRDWLYFVNGIEADVGAAERHLRAGDTAWWDLRLWRSYLHVPAVVGLWPEPFVHGWRGARPTVAADPPLAAALRRAGAQVAAASPAGYRVLVGSDAELRRRAPAWRRAAGHPVRNGLTVWIAGGAVQVYRSSTNRPQPVPRAAALAAAVQTGTTAASGVTFVVAGLDAAAAAAAARTVASRPSVLRRRYAVAFDRNGRVVAAGGIGPVAG